MSFNSPTAPQSNIDFSNMLEAMNAVQRNPQLQAKPYVFGAGAGLSTAFTGSAVYAIFADSGTLTVTGASSTWSYKVTGGAVPGAAVFPFGLPLGYPAPQGGASTFVVSTSTVVATIVYK